MPALLMRVVVATLLLQGLAAHAEGGLTFHTRYQIETSRYVPPKNEHTDLDPPVSDRPFTPVYKTITWAPAKTAIVVCDMWDTLKNQIPADRVAELAPPMNEVLKSARAKGVLIIHAPSGTTEFYNETPQRARCKNAPVIEANPPLQWNNLDATRETALPVDDSDNGWEGPLLENQQQTRQQPAIEIGEEDAIGEGNEVYYLLKQRGIENVILMGVHTNMCILGRPFGIRQLTYLGMNVLLMRDMTDSLYNPEMHPKVSHFRGTEMIIEHIEQYWCPTVLSTDLTAKPAFRFAEDKRPRLAIIVSDDHYHADKTLPVFAQFLRESHGIDCLVLHGEGGHDIPNTANLETADALIVFVRRLGLANDQMQAVKDFVAAGKPVIGLRTASHAFKLKNAPDGSYPVPEGRAEWGGFDHEILGGSYTGHGSNELGADIKNVNPGHPLMKGVEPFEWHSGGSLYNAKPIADDATLLMEGSTREGTEPVAWYCEAAPGRGKVFYSSLGYPADFREPAFRQMLINAVVWALH